MSSEIRKFIQQAISYYPQRDSWNSFFSRAAQANLDQKEIYNTLRFASEILPQQYFWVRNKLQPVIRNHFRLLQYYSIHSYNASILAKRTIVSGSLIAGSVTMALFGAPLIATLGIAALATIYFATMPWSMKSLPRDRVVEFMGPIFLRKAIEEDLLTLQKSWLIP